MAWSIDTAFVHEFENRIHHNLAENPVFWRQTCRVKNGVRGKTYNFERLGSIEMVSIPSRHSDTVLTPLTHSRRRLTLTDKGASEMIDDLDEVKMLISPQSDYAARFAESFNRFLGDIVIAALGGNSQAVDADDATSNVALSQLAVPVGARANAGVGANVIAAGGTGFTMAKLRTAVRVADLNNMPSDSRYITVNPYAIEDLMADSTVSSSDFSNLQIINQGGIGQGIQWFGMTWFKSNQLPLSGTTRTAYMWHRDAMVLGLAMDLQTSIDRVPLKWNSTLVQVKASLGAVRVEEERVLSIDYVEA